jgi:hypothetical protein
MCEFAADFCGEQKMRNHSVRFGIAYLPNGVRRLIFAWRLDTCDALTAS